MAGTPGGNCGADCAFFGPFLLSCRNASPLAVVVCCSKSASRGVAGRASGDAGLQPRTPAAPTANVTSQAAELRTRVAFMRRFSSGLTGFSFWGQMECHHTAASMELAIEEDTPKGRKECHAQTGRTGAAYRFSFSNPLVRNDSYRRGVSL